MQLDVVVAVVDVVVLMPATRFGISYSFGTESMMPGCHVVQVELDLLEISGKSFLALVVLFLLHLENITS